MLRGLAIPAVHCGGGAMPLLGAVVLNVGAVVRIAGTLVLMDGAVVLIVDVVVPVDEALVRLAGPCVRLTCALLPGRRLASPARLSRQ